MSNSYEHVEIDSAQQWREWLARNHATSPGIWLVTWKKGRGPWLSYDQIVDEALSFGWVDSRPRSIDTDRSERLLTPRRPGSNWSRVNKDRVARLESDGRMTDAGRAVVRRARQDGSWAALDEVEDLVEPDDLRAALAANPAARAQWDTFPRSAKRAILEWISSAKTDATRGKRIVRTVAEAADGRRANQWRQPGMTRP
jgi:uncharacterized protein YdeI (YjbR/CyaY-like superfamily)